MNKTLTSLQIFIIAVGFSLLLACNVEYQSLAGTAIKVNANEKSGILFSEIFDSIRYVKLETTDDILLGGIEVIKYANNRIYILDRRKALFSFDATTGKCLWKIQSIGQGPKEYIQPMSIDIDEKNERLYLFCHGEKIIEYDLSGNFIKAYNVRLWGINIAAANDYLYIYTGNTLNWINNQKSYNYLLIYNKKDNSLTAELPFEDNLSHGTIRIYNSSNAFYHHNDEVRFFSPYSYNIYSIKGDMVDIAYRFDFGKLNLPKEFGDYRQKDLEQINYAYGLNSAWENDRYFGAALQINQLPYNILLDKKEGRVMSGHFYDDIGECINQFEQATNDFAMGYIPTEILFMHKNENTFVKKITSELKEDDNPVVFFYYFKK